MSYFDFGSRGSGSIPDMGFALYSSTVERFVTLSNLLHKQAELHFEKARVARGELLRTTQVVE